MLKSDIRVLQACVATSKIIILQAANTSLTGGATPAGNDYDQDVVLINTMHMAKIYVIDEERQVICLPGATLFQLERTLEAHGRDPHSVIGSSCIGASVIGGICNNSGGALVRCGPAYRKWRCPLNCTVTVTCGWSIIWASRWARIPKRS